MQLRKLWLLVSIALTSLSAQANSEELDTFTNISLGLTNIDALANPYDVELADKWMPTIGVGAGFTTPLAPDWQWQTEVSFEYSQGTTALADKSHLPVDITNQGVWLSNTIKRLNLVENVSPFVSLDVGRVQTELQFADNQQQQWQTGYRALVGLEFALPNDMSFSLAFGHSDFD